MCPDKAQRYASKQDSHMHPTGLWIFSRDAAHLYRDRRCTVTEVQNILGTSGLKDTVEKAFDEVVRAELRRRLADRIASGDGIDRNPIALEASKRW
jgi:hypothetical protein